MCLHCTDKPQACNYFPVHFITRVQNAVTCDGPVTVHNSSSIETNFWHSLG